jgi:hypothetical protein
MEKYLRFRGKVEASQDQCYHIMGGTFFKIDAQSHCLAKSLQDKFGSFYIISVGIDEHCHIVRTHGRPPLSHSEWEQRKYLARQRGQEASAKGPWLG